MQDSRETYAAIHRLLASEGVVILHTGRAPVNPVNLFDMLVARSSGVVIKVADDFVEEIRAHADDAVPSC